MSHTGENEMGLRKIMDMTRFASMTILLLHCYYYCYRAFDEWRLTHTISDRLLLNIKQTGLFDHWLISRMLALVLLAISLLGNRGRKSQKLHPASIFWCSVSGLLLYSASYIILTLPGKPTQITTIYLVVTCIGYLLMLTGGALLSRLIYQRLSKDIFNEKNETFPQEERKIENDYSINLRARYKYRGKIRNSWVSFSNPFRGILITGSPGSGKSWFIIQHIIRQSIEKKFCLLIYDFKYDDLTRIAYNCYLKNKHKYPVTPSFYVINFDDLSVSHRCNPLDPQAMHDITDATESARCLLLSINKSWITRQGDFFVESPINFVTAVIWYLRKYENGKYCTLPHVIEMIQVEYRELFAVLNTEPEIQVLLNPFKSAFDNDAMEQLEGQIASAKIVLSRLASPSLYWVLSGNDFTLDINNPQHPKIVCMGNNPEKQQIYGAVLSLYFSRLARIVNKKGQLPCSLIFDEFPTIFFNHMDSLIATARSNKISAVLGMQDFSQLRKDYGKEQADVIVNITGNIISGQVTGDTAKQLSERFGKIIQERESLTVNRMDTSVNRSTQLDYAIPPSKISSLSSGEFVGMMADDPNAKIKLKMFNNELITETEKLNEEMKSYKSPPVVYDMSQKPEMDNSFQIKYQVRMIIQQEIAKIEMNKEYDEEDDLGNN